MASSKIKILCLHGYQQNARIFIEKSGAFRKSLKNIEFYAINAPFNVGNVTDDEKDPRAWYFSNKDYVMESGVHDECIGLEKSLEVIDETCVKNGPFHGLLGFSQGAGLAAIICASDQMEGRKRFQFVVLISGYKSLLKPHAKFFEKIIHMPSLHIIGEADTIVKPEYSEIMAEQFDPAKRVIAKHPKGHVISYDKEIAVICKNFIEKHSKHLNQSLDELDPLQSSL